MYLAISLSVVLIIMSMLLTNWNLINCKKIAKIWEEMAFKAIEEANKEREQAEAFEQDAKAMEDKLHAECARSDYFETMLHKCEEERDWLKENQKLIVNCTSTEEHLAAERGRADRLAEALRMSEDARCELKQQLEKMRKQVNTTGSTILDEMKRRGEKPVFTAVMQRDLANIMAYNGTAQSQEVLTDE